MDFTCPWTGILHAEIVAGVGPADDRENPGNISARPDSSSRACAKSETENILRIECRTRLSRSVEIERNTVYLG
jgi:hypothetical protein